jgi:hypothetical protein
VVVSSGYRIKNMKTHELSKNREEKYFLKDVMGVIENQHLVRIWGRQKDITAHRLKSGEPVFRIPTENVGMLNVNPLTKIVRGQLTQ